MPIVSVDKIKRIEHLIEFWLEEFNESKELLGFNFVGGYDDPITTAYPAIQIGSGQTTKDIHATHMFLFDWLLDIYILHAQAEETHRVRSKEMLELVTKVVAFMEKDMSLGEKIIHGYVTSERPGVIRPRSNPGVFVVSTSIQYRAIAEVPF